MPKYSDFVPIIDNFKTRKRTGEEPKQVDFSTEIWYNGIDKANYAQSKADFVAKLQIALKECYETEYWLELFGKAELTERENAKKVYTDCGTIRRILIFSINTAKSKADKQ